MSKPSIIRPDYRGKAPDGAYLRPLKSEYVPFLAIWLLYFGTHSSQVCAQPKNMQKILLSKTALSRQASLQGFNLTWSHKNEFNYAAYNK